MGRDGRSVVSAFVESLTNEWDHDVTVAVSLIPKDVNYGGLSDGVLIHVTGPDSEVDHLWTRAEAESIARGLAVALSQPDGDVLAGRLRLVSCPDDGRACAVFADFVNSVVSCTTHPTPVPLTPPSPEGTPS